MIRKLFTLTTGYLTDPGVHRVDPAAGRQLLTNPPDYKKGVAPDILSDFLSLTTWTDAQPVTLAEYPHNRLYTSVNLLLALYLL